MTQQNLSEKLFKPRVRQVETSTLVSYSSHTLSQFKDHSVLSGSQHTHWYRMINRLLWIWRGIDAIEIEEVLSRIAVADAKRSSDEWLDTIIGNRRGNWCFEWSTQAMHWQQKALKYEKGDKASEAWLHAANLYSIAAYPFIKGDELADQAILLACKAYDSAAKFSDYQLKKIAFKVDGGKEVCGFLHIPSGVQGPYPTVMVCGMLDSLQIDYSRYFRDYLEPLGIAMLTLDMPSIGYSIKYNLSQETSTLHEQIVRQLDTIPWIDHTRFGITGIRFGANIAIRLAYMCPDKIKAVATIGPIVHSLLHEEKYQKNIPRMVLDVFASRLGIFQVDGQSLRHELSCYSLKTQGLLGRRNRVPMMSVCFKDDPYSPKADSDLIIRSSMDSHLLVLPNSPVFEAFERSMSETTKWLESKIL
ncbi:fermentation/respiration switch protein [Providencia rustigianii]|uniref:Esterase FrsA n=2 Tax=Providencia rustigianii TaxID=158850 RepID=A0A379G241_9GAMM|nr:MULTISPECIES: esterase FrsA [Providencia]MTC58388.1 esterase FrsA [Providencia rustigianii]SUC26009.1 fermentation/respiration switch protein [Providencia rustigianii]SUC34713.1 fermentation/respiration switch protein [Providencia rustigianii]VEB66900.1 fermentation/respiration switch protein [Providencia rustigianii]